MLLSLCYIRLLKCIQAEKLRNMTKKTRNCCLRLLNILMPTLQKTSLLMLWQSISDIVTDIIANVVSRGDEAIFEYAQRFDKATLTSLEVTEDEIEEAVASVEPEFLRILSDAAANIRAFHEKQVRNSFIISEKDGVVVGQKVTPIEKVGLYVPGGTAAYPSTVLMDAIPATIAGCSEIVMVTPPSASGKVNPVILAAAKVAGVTRIFKMGGAQAVAALAYGTESVPRVDKIVGPGNAYVAEAKKQVFGRVSIDMIAGPSEILVVADATCNPKFVAADLLSQAEHDRMASAVLVTDTYELAEAVSAELERQIPLLFRGALSPRMYQIIFPTVCMVNILITSFSHTIVSVGYDLWGGYPMVLLVSAGGLALCAVIALGLQLHSKKAK